MSLDLETVTVKLKAKDNPKIKFGIDRQEENKDVRAYVESGDETIFNRIYNRRIPTINFLAKRYNWLCEDAASEIGIVLVRSVNKYRNGQKTDFNTYFFTSVKNHFSNIAKKRFRKKRTTFDGLDPATRTIQLDSFINDDDSSSNFHEFICDENSEFEKNEMKEHYFHSLSEGNTFVSQIIERVAEMSNKQVTKKKMLFNFKFSIMSGDVFEDVVSQIGLPKKVFEVKKARVKSGIIDSVVSIDGDKLMKHFVEKINFSL